MLARAHGRFAAERRRARRHGAGRDGALPNLIVIGGLKCGTTSLHHYLNLHPQIAMSRPKELNFFVVELNWELGVDWYRSHFEADAPVRGETSPHYTNRPRFEGVAERMREVLGAEARVVYMVRHPIDRLLSHYLHNVGGGYEERELPEAVADPGTAYVQRGLYAFQLEPYLAAFDRERVLVISREELADERGATVRRVFEFAGVDPEFTSPEFDREWETGSGKGSGGFRLMDRAVRLPGLRALDRNFDRLPERLRWVVERLVHDPDSGEAPKPELDPALRERLGGLFRDDVARLEELAGRSFGWQL
jgi:hypothetical protein